MGDAVAQVVRGATGGGRGVGMGTTRAVVIASVVTLVGDYFQTDILLAIFHPGKT